MFQFHPQQISKPSLFYTAIVINILPYFTSCYDRAYQIYQGPAQRILHDGDCLELGDRRLLVIHTPGHSPGHCCFCEPDRKYLYSGDLLYKGCLDAFYPTTDPQLFLQSIRRIQEYTVNRILPGHHSLEIPVSMIADIEGGFSKLQREGKLQQGNGIFDFGDFQIHI